MQSGQVASALKLSSKFAGDPIQTQTAIPYNTNRAAAPCLVHDLKVSGV